MADSQHSILNTSGVLNKLTKMNAAKKNTHFILNTQGFASTGMTAANTNHTSNKTPVRNFSRPQTTLGCRYEKNTTSQVNFGGGGTDLGSAFAGRQTFTLLQNAIQRPIPTISNSKEDAYRLQTISGSAQPRVDSGRSRLLSTIQHEANRNQGVAGVDYQYKAEPCKGVSAQRGRGQQHMFLTQKNRDGSKTVNVRQSLDVANLRKGVNDLAVHGQGASKIGRQATKEVSQSLSVLNRERQPAQGTDKYRTLSPNAMRVSVNPMELAESAYPATPLNQDSVQPKGRRTLIRPTSCAAKSMDFQKPLRAARPMSSCSGQQMRASTDELLKYQKKRLHAITLSTFDSFYRIPIHDHRYKINATNYIKQEKEPKTYMNQVLKRAKSQIDPTKYSVQLDWRSKSRKELVGLIPREEKVLFTAQVIRDKKAIPGPSVYKSTWLKPKTKGFYRNASSRISIFEEQIQEKKKIPAPSKYDTIKGLAKESKEKYRGVSASDIDAKRRDKLGRTARVKKNSRPGPSSYKTAQSVDQCVLKSQNNTMIDKAKNINFIQALLKNKKFVPGVGSYKNLETAKDKIVVSAPLQSRKR